LGLPIEINDAPKIKVLFVMYLLCVCIISSFSEDREIMNICKGINVMKTTHSPHRLCFGKAGIHIVFFLSIAGWSQFDDFEYHDFFDSSSGFALPGCKELVPNP
jgi:hypothetical protein